MLLEIMKYCRVVDKYVKERRFGKYEIVDGSISLPFAKEGQYFLVEGSVFNDGVYCYGQDLLRKDEEFYGHISTMAIPPDFLELVEEVKTWKEKYDGENGGLESPYTSESFNGYNYSRKTGANAGNYTWRDAFSHRLAVYKRK